MSTDTPTYTVDLNHVLYSSYSQEPSPIAGTSHKWHPKVTPYRLITLLTTLCIGTVKAVVVQRGSQNEPITLEWVSSVVIFLVLFNLGSYEDSPSHHIPSYLSWLFEPDCMDAVWWFLSLVYPSFRRPSYTSEETAMAPGSTHIVTGYRLLVSSVVVSSGILKAGLTYYGISTGANWIEWISGTMITSILYIVGLYEHNTANQWSSFFDTDRANVVMKGFLILSMLFIILFLILAACFTAFDAWILASATLDAKDYIGSQSPFLTKVFDSSTSLLLSTSAMTCIMFTVYLLYAAVKLIVDVTDYRFHVPDMAHRFLAKVSAVWTVIARSLPDLDRLCDKLLVPIIIIAVAVYLYFFIFFIVVAGSRF